MEKPAAAFKSKNRLLKLLPKVASAVTFQSPPFSPSKEKMRSSAETICSTKPKTHLGKGSSGGAGPMTSIIPAEAIYKSTSFAAHEPTSPKVSCMGQIKHKKKLCNYYQDALPPMEYLDQVLNFNHKAKALKSVQSFSEVKKKNIPRVLKPVQPFKNMFGKAGGKKSGSHVDPDLGVRARPCLSQMHRFSSGRSSLSSFDWTVAQIAPVGSDHDRNNIYDGGEDKLCFTAPIQIGGCKAVRLEPRKEINLWKRRTMAQPKPLQLNAL